MSHRNDDVELLQPDAALKAVEERLGDLTDRVAERPWTSVGIAFAVGGLIGIVDRRAGLFGGIVFALAMRAARSYAVDELSDRVAAWLASAPSAGSLALAGGGQEEPAPVRRKKAPRRSKRPRQPKA